MKIALALSGGGFRATVFHLGVLARLAVDEHDLFPQVTFLSTVSGGSLCAGLVYALSGFEWPSSKHYLKVVMPEARRLLTTFDLQGALIWETLGQIWTLFLPRTGMLSRLMRQHWGVTAKLADVPQKPHWLINSCCYESGKNFRFEPHRMGDYLIGYTRPGDLLLADALAASAGFPGLIGYLPLDTTKYSWFKYNHEDSDSLFLNWDQHPETQSISPAFKKLHLWDGGAYDNQGIEGLTDYQTGWRSNIDFLIVSEASGKSQLTRYTWGLPALYHLMTGIMMEQVRSLRARAVLEQMELRGEQGSYLRIGNTCSYILRKAGRSQEIPAVEKRYLSKDEVQQAASTPTMIRKLAPDEYERLFRHGYETADYTLYAYHAEADAQPIQFKLMGYDAL